jgi:hypothetical protein
LTVGFFLTVFPVALGQAGVVQADQPDDSACGLGGDAPTVGDGVVGQFEYLTLPVLGDRWTFS